MRHSSFDAMISALVAVRCGDVGDRARRSFDATILALDVETSAIARSFRQYWCRVFADCGVGVTPQIWNRVTIYGDMGTFSRPDPTPPQEQPWHSCKLGNCNCHLIGTPDLDWLGRHDDIQLIAPGHSYKVIGCNTMRIYGFRTEPLLMMAIQITHKQERALHILSLHSSH